MERPAESRNRHLDVILSQIGKKESVIGVARDQNGHVVLLAERSGDIRDDAHIHRLALLAGIVNIRPASRHKIPLLLQHLVEDNPLLLGLTTTRPIGLFQNLLGRKSTVGLRGRKETNRLPGPERPVTLLNDIRLMNEILLPAVSAADESKTLTLTPALDATHYHLLAVLGQKREADIVIQLNIIRRHDTGISLENLRNERSLERPIINSSPTIPTIRLRKGGKRPVKEVAVNRDTNRIVHSLNLHFQMVVENWNDSLENTSSALLV